MKKTLLWAIWAGILFIPFKGIVAGLILALVIFFLGILGRPIISSLRKIPRVEIPKIPRYIYLPLAVVVFLGIPFINDYITDIAILAGIYALLALGLNIVVGFAGLLNLGFAAFYAIGAYSYALLNTKAGLGFWSALPASMAASTIFGLILAMPALRLRGDYLAIVTLGFGEMTRLILNNWDSLTNGPNGISGIARPSIINYNLNSLRDYYFLVLILLILSSMVIKRIYSSKTGRAWSAIRENEIAASACGINVTYYKLYAFAFGAFWAGLAGALFASKMGFISPESFTFMESVFILSMVILGGMGRVSGAILGAVLLVGLPELLRGVELYRMISLGAGLVLLMIFRPQGILGGRTRVSS